MADEMGRDEPDNEPEYVDIYYWPARHVEAQCDRFVHVAAVRDIWQVAPHKNAGDRSGFVKLCGECLAKTAADGCSECRDFTALVVQDVLVTGQMNDGRMVHTVRRPKTKAQEEEKEPRLVEVDLAEAERRIVDRKTETGRIDASWTLGEYQDRLDALRKTIERQEREIVAVRRRFDDERRKVELQQEKAVEYGDFILHVEKFVGKRIWNSLWWDWTETLQERKAAGEKRTKRETWQEDAARYELKTSLDPASRVEVRERPGALQLRRTDKDPDTDGGMWYEVSQEVERGVCQTCGWGANSGGTVVYSWKNSQVCRRCLVDDFGTD